MLQALLGVVGDFSNVVYTDQIMQEQKDNIANMVSISTECAADD